MSSPSNKSDASSEHGARRFSPIERTLASVLDVGRELLANRRNARPTAKTRVQALTNDCKELLDHRGEASGLALASEIADTYLVLQDQERLGFFTALSEEFDVDAEQIINAAEKYKEQPDQRALEAIAHCVEAPRQKLFRRINMAPNGTAVLVAMRGHLLAHLRARPELRGVDQDLKHLFISWFNKGFLELRKVDWSSPAVILDRIIDYEAVHEINGWDDLRSRLQDDRRCFAFFHPALPDDPLVFVEIALTNEIPGAIAPLLRQEREFSPDEPVNTVVFYSISNCHPGLAGVSFGNFLIKNVVEKLAQEIPGLKTFVTLSPVPGFRKWLLNADLTELVDTSLIEKVKEPVGSVVKTEVYEAHLKLCAHYLLHEKSGELPKDPVARFHLGNGARLHRIHGGADLSAKGREQSAGIMVNYLYDLSQIELNHEEFFEQGKIAASRTVLKVAS
ncbi:MAG: malonyl-CoA decarboxylase [Halioglobus sp.]